MTTTARSVPEALGSRGLTKLPEPLAERVRLFVARRLEGRLRRSRAVRGAALVFHAVALRAGNLELEIDPPVERGRLEAAVGYLARNYTLVRAAELPDAARARRPGESVPVAVTFDDDLISHRDHALPVFRRHGAVATAFLSGAQTASWWQLLQVAVDTRAIAPSSLPRVAPELVAEALERRPRAIKRLAKAIEELDPPHRDRVAAVLSQAVQEPHPPLGADGAAALAAAGWEIGFHTSRHDRLTALDDHAMREALRCGWTQPNGARPQTLAYPHGKATAREARAAREAGYLAAYTGRADVITDRTDVHLIGRLQPDSATLGRFALQLARALSAP